MSDPNKAPLSILIAHLVKTDASFEVEYMDLVNDDTNEDQFQYDLMDLIKDRLVSRDYEEAFTSLRYGDPVKEREGLSYKEQLMEPLRAMDKIREGEV